MDLEVLLFSVEVMYLWRALSFCPVSVKQSLLDRLSAPLPPGAQVFHRALSAWLKGGLLSSLKQPVEADKVGGLGGGGEEQLGECHCESCPSLPSYCNQHCT